MKPADSRRRTDLDLSDMSVEQLRSVAESLERSMSVAHEQWGANPGRENLDALFDVLAELSDRGETGEELDNALVKSLGLPVSRPRFTAWGIQKAIE